MNFGYNEGRDVAFGGTEADDWSKYFSGATAGDSGANTGRDAIAAEYLLATRMCSTQPKPRARILPISRKNTSWPSAQDEGRTFFDRFQYNQDNPDVAAAGVDPTAHWFDFGQKEGRTAPQSSVFNRETYRLLNPDVAAAAWTRSSTG